MTRPYRILPDAALNDAYFGSKAQIRATAARGPAGESACLTLLEAQMEAAHRPGFRFDRDAWDDRREMRRSAN